MKPKPVSEKEHKRFKQGYIQGRADALREATKIARKHKRSMTVYDNACEDIAKKIEELGVKSE